MIKITTLHCKNEKAPNLVLIPGGPGMSSKTLRSMDLLNRSFHLHYVDFPGTNGNPYTKDHTFEELSRGLLGKINTLSGKTYILGHSFGGFFAADIANLHDVDGLICIATPFSGKSLQGASENYEKNITPELEAAEKKWSETPNDSNYSNYLSEYNELYFSPHSLESGRKLLLEDKGSSAFSLANRADASKMEILLDKMNSLSIKKLMIAGKDDGLLNLNDLDEDSARGGFSFSVVNSANHFVMFDQPEIVAGLIEEFCDKKTEK